MKPKKLVVRVSLAFVLGFALQGSCTVPADSSRAEESKGWLLPSIGRGVGNWGASVGAFAGGHDLHLRNLQLRGDVDLAPGLRAHAVIRSNSELNGLGEFHPHVDEGYVEGYGFHRSACGVFSGSIRVGATRYLRFPYPDAISLFDQPPGVTDLGSGGSSGGPEAGYNGALATLDYAHKSGFGAHYTGIEWGFGRHGGGDTIEGYGFFRRDFGSVHLEARGGRLQLRPEPLGRSATGYNAFLGVGVRQFAVGLIYEKLHDQPAYTGISVRFAPTRVTRALGAVSFDYDRNPNGIAVQLPIFSARIGGLSRLAPKAGELVGEIRAERFRTYWQNGQNRDYYEHRVSSWGETGTRGLKVVVDEKPWTLQYEVIVSPHVLLRDGFGEWISDRQGPAQVTQEVVYRFYRISAPR